LPTSNGGPYDKTGHAAQRLSGANGSTIRPASAARRFLSDTVPYADPYLQPMTSLSSRLARAAWGIVCLLLFRPSPRPCHAWRAFLLRCFGARLGSHCHIYPRARIWAPWNLRCGDAACIADDAEVYNHAPVTLDSHAIVSQQACLCSATHDMHDAAFPIVARPIRIGRRAWVCARATVMPGVSLGEGAVLALGSVATKDLAPWTIYGGLPARQIGMRRHRAESMDRPGRSDNE
jgi:putative colanic acid biosynthesis acetyltransferase WcaF